MQTLRVGFFGTYFSNLQELLKNIAIQTNYKVQLFTDKESNGILFDSSLVGVRHLSTDIPTTFSDEVSNLDYCFNCDFDRMQEFNHFIPQKYELELNAQAIKKAFQHWYSQNKFDLLICEGPHNFFNNVIIEWLEENDLTYFSIRSGRLPGTTYIEKNRITLRNKTFSTVMHKHAPVDYMVKTHPNHRGLIEKLKNFTTTDLYNDIRVILQKPNSIRRESLFSYHIPRLNLLFKTRRLFLRKSIQNFCLIRDFRSSKNENMKFILYPEHYRPEAATSAYDFEYKDDLYNLIRIIPQLPSNTKLLFRFHPSYFTRRPHKQIKFLMELAKNQKIFLSYPEDKLDDILETVEGVITVSSSVAIDALRKNKKVIILGNPEYFKTLQQFGLYKQEISNLNVETLLSKPVEKVEKTKVDNALSQIYHPGSVSAATWIHAIGRDLELT